jgi:hypothetical protein
MAREVDLATQVVPGETGTRIVESTQTESVAINLPTEAITTTTPLVATLSPTPDAPILEPGGPGAAIDLQSEVDCENPGEAIARLSWSPAATKGAKQRVDVTIFKDGFQMGEFEASEVLPLDQSSLIWEQVSPGLNHRWRVLTLQENGWIPSEIAIFKGPVCVGDEEEELPSTTPVIQ